MERAELGRLLSKSGGERLMEAAAGCAVASPAVLAAESPADFMRQFTAAVVAGGPVFLTDPAWGEVQLQGVRELMALADGDNARDGGGESGWLMIPSGGTSGGLKFARHDQDTLAVAVRGFCAHFGMARVNAVGLLPLHHVSGLMAWMRCGLTGGMYLPWNWQDLRDGRRPELAREADWVLSLVPTQLQRLLEIPDAVEWLRQFKVIFIGGGPVWPELTEAAARASLPISLSYGMTETAAMVTALRPVEFAAGVRDSGAALPHARVTVTAEGVVMIGGESLFRGYFPERSESREFQTEDLGEIDAQGHLRIAGRRDAMIITGGKKVQPAEVETVLRATGLFADVAVVGVPDAEWGEAVVVCYPSDGTAAENAAVGVQAMAQVSNGPLLAYQRPKRYVAIVAADWPRNAQGKLNRAVVRERAMRVR